MVYMLALLSWWCLPNTVRQPDLSSVIQSICCMRQCVQLHHLLLWWMIHTLWKTTSTEQSVVRLFNTVGSYEVASHILQFAGNIRSSSTLRCLASDLVLCASEPASVNSSHPVTHDDTELKPFEPVQKVGSFWACLNTLNGLQTHIAASKLLSCCNKYCWCRWVVAIKHRKYESSSFLQKPDGMRGPDCMIAA